MVKAIYPAIYTDNLGCDKAEVYFLENGVYLEVRGYTFYSEYFDFDFGTLNSSNFDVRKNFYLKDNELTEYVLDIRIPLTLKYKMVSCVEKFILRVERYNNYYKNSLLLSSNDVLYKVEGYNFYELLINMKKKLVKEDILNINNACTVKI